MLSDYKHPITVPNCVSEALSLLDLARLWVVSHGGPAHGHTILEIFLENIYAIHLTLRVTELLNLTNVG